MNRDYLRRLASFINLRRPRRRPFDRCWQSRGAMLETLEHRTMLSAQGLDASFADAGKAVTAFVGPESYGNGVAVQSDGKIVVVGETGKTSVDFPDIPRFDGGYALARYNPDGSLDPTFGTGGKVETPIVAHHAGANAVAIEPDGKIIVVGSDGLSRYNSDGSIDSGFGNNGFVSPGGSRWVMIEGDKIVTASPTALRRFNDDGSPDTTFGNQGVISGQGFEQFAIDSQGRIDVVTSQRIYRYYPNGTLDTSFGNGGQVLVPGAAGESGHRSIAIESDGKLVWAGEVGDTGIPGINSRINVERFNVDGSLDKTFGPDGVVRITSGQQNTGVGGLLIQPDGKVVVAGRTGGASGGMGQSLFTGDMFMARLNPNGTLDSTWGSGGMSKIVVGADGEAYAIAEQPNGQIVIAGTNGSALVVARFADDFNQSLVEHVYLDVLGRAADPGGLDYYANLVDQGQVNRAQLEQLIAASPEHQRHVVTQVFEQYLNRAPDAGGLNYWSNFLAAGGTQEQLESRILGSDEFFQLSGGSDTTFLESLFLDVLSRPIDPSAAQSFGQALAQGATRTQAADHVLRSTEHNGQVVSSFYQDYLGRPADDGGLAYFSNLLAGGASWEQVSTVLIACEEYFSGM